MTLPGFTAEFSWNNDKIISSRVYHNDKSILLVS